MEFLDLVKKRRSIRSYIPRPVDRKLLSKCIEAARFAPSACNVQPWRFIVIDDRKLIMELAEKACCGIYSQNNFIKDAGALIVVVSEKETFIRKLGSQIKGTNYYLIDIGIACEHLILQATELGLATCWIGWFSEKGAKKILDVPKNKRIDVIIPIGYSEYNVPVRKTRKEFLEIASFNKY